MTTKGNTDSGAASWLSQRLQTYSEIWGSFFQKLSFLSGLGPFWALYLGAHLLYNLVLLRQHSHQLTLDLQVKGIEMSVAVRFARGERHLVNVLLRQDSAAGLAAASAHM